MVKAPVDTVLAMALPDTEPKSARAASRLAGERHRQVDEEFAGPRLVEEGAEEDEEDDVGGQDVGHHPEDPVGGEIEGGRQALDAEPAVGDDARQIGAEVGVGEHPDADRGHRHAEHPAADLERQQDADDRHQGVELGLGAGAVVQSLELVDPVVDHQPRDHRQEDVQGARVLRRARRQLAVDPEQPRRDGDRHQGQGQEPHRRRETSFADRHQTGVEGGDVVVEEEGGGGPGQDRAREQRQEAAHRVLRRRVEEEHQDVGDEDVDAAVVLGGDRGNAGGVEVEEHHRRPEGGDHPVPEALGAAGGLGVLLQELFDFFFRFRVFQSRDFRIF